jgi:hypothetical protein
MGNRVINKQRKKEVRKNTAFMAEPSLIQELDYYADLMGLSRSQLIRNIIDASVEEFKVLEKTGILKSVVTVRDLFTLGERAERRKKKPA